MTLPDPSQWPVERVFEDRVADFLRERAVSTPDRLGVVDADSGERWTFGEFDHLVSDRVQKIDSLFDRYPDRVATLLDTGVAFAEVAFAVARQASLLVPMNVELDEEALADRIERADVDAVVCESATESTALAATPGDVTVGSVDEPERDSAASVVPEVEALTRPSRIAPGDERLIAFTSGTTGRPKGVRLTARNLAASANTSAARLGVEPDDRWLVCLPMYHVGGLSPLLRSTLYGTTTVLQREFDPDGAVRVVDRYDVTGVSLVPTMLDRLLDAGWSPPERLRFVLLGGGPAPESLVERALDRGVPVCPTYGTTETASQIATATPEAVADHPGTVGRPLRDTDVTIVDDGAPVSTGETGELVVDGPTVTPGYLDADETDAAFGPRGLHTGDLGFGDEAGRLWIAGRLDDAVVTGGETVHPSRVVDALRGIGWIDDAVVVGLPDDEWGERVSALVVPAAREEIDAGRGSAPTERVRAAVRDRLPDYALPKTVVIADELPRTASGTIDRRAVVERLADVAR